MTHMNKHKEHFDIAHNGLPGVHFVPLQLFFAHPNYREVLKESVIKMSERIASHMGENASFVSPGEKILEVLCEALDFAEMGALIALRREVRRAESLVRSAFRGPVVVDFCVESGLLYDEVRRQDFNRKRNIGAKMVQISEVSVARKLARDTERQPRVKQAS